MRMRQASHNDRAIAPSTCADGQTGAPRPSQPPLPQRVFHGDRPDSLSVEPNYAFAEGGKRAKEEYIGPRARRRTLKAHSLRPTGRCCGRPNRLLDALAPGTITKADLRASRVLRGGRDADRAQRETCA